MNGEAKKKENDLEAKIQYVKNEVEKVAIYHDKKIDKVENYDFSSGYSLNGKCQAPFFEIQDCSFWN